MLHSQFEEELERLTNNSVFTNTMPTNIQEHICSTVEKDVQYTTVNEKVGTMIQNKMARTLDTLVRSEAY